MNPTLLNAIPVFGWLIAGILSLLIAIPVFFLWNWLAPIYFSFLPVIWLAIPFWHTVGLVWLISSVKALIFPSFSVSNGNSK